MSLRSRSSRSSLIDASRCSTELKLDPADITAADAAAVDDGGDGGVRSICFTILLCTADNAETSSSEFTLISIVSVGLDVFRKTSEASLSHTMRRTYSD